MRTVIRRTGLTLALLLVSAGTASARARPISRSATAQPAVVATSEGCTYTVSSVIEPGSIPPIYDTVVTREASEGCALPSASVVVNSSYLDPSLSIDVSGRFIAVSSSQKYTPSGSAHVSLALIGLDAQTLTVVQRTTLAAMSLTYPYLGNVYSGQVRILGQSLFVTGTFNGDIPGMFGSGEQYLALYANFFRVPQGPAPTVVLAY